jgi:hypothetical protein
MHTIVHELSCLLMDSACVGAEATICTKGLIADFAFGMVVMRDDVVCVFLLIRNISLAVLTFSRKIL